MAWLPLEQPSSGAVALLRQMKPLRSKASVQERREELLELDADSLATWGRLKLRIDERGADAIPSAGSPRSSAQATDQISLLTRGAGLRLPEATGRAKGVIT